MVVLKGRAFLNSVFDLNGNYSGSILKKAMAGFVTLGNTGITSHIKGYSLSNKMKLHHLTKEFYNSISIGGIEAAIYLCRPALVNNPFAFQCWDES